MKNKHYQRIFFHLLSKIQTGQIVLELPDETHHFFGEPTNADSPIHLKVNDTDFFKRVILQKDIGLGESYMLKEWDCDDLAGFIKLLIKNQEHITKGSGSGPILQLLRTILLSGEKLKHRLNSNTKQNSVKNIHAHYDLGNEFYGHFLDESMTYSSAYFSYPAQDLESAQFEKYDRLCRKLALEPHHHVLEIGSGWGGFAMHAATHYGCQVTTVTVSEEQYAYAKAKLEETGLENQVTLLLQDYRDITGAFDRIVSIEMLEAVGHEHLNSYFSQCSKLLKPDGIFGFQVILSPNSHYKSYRKSVDFIRKHIFPGGHLPSVGSIQKVIEKSSDWDLLHMETFGTHYAETLRRWEKRFEEKTAERAKLGFDTTFDRKWKFYFNYCEAGFDARHIQVAQFVYSNPNNEHYCYEDQDLIHSKQAFNNLERLNYS